MNRVLVFCEYGTINGGENSLFALLPQLQNHGWEFTFALPCPSPFSQRLQSIGVHVEPLELFVRRERKPLAEIRGELAKIIARVDHDLVHANSLNMSRMLGGVAAEFPKLPMIGHLRDIIKLNRTALSDLNQLDRIIAVSNATADFHVRAGLDRNRVHVLYNGVDLELFQPREKNYGLHDQLGVEYDSTIALSIGQIGLRKGWDTLLLAAEKLPLKSLNLHFVIAGERHSEKRESIEFEKRLHEQAKNKSLDGHVHFVGRLKDIHRAMNSADFLVHTARQEPLGRVLLESAAAGLPVIATNVGGTSEIFVEPDREQESLASLVEKDCVDQLAGAISNMVTCGGKRNQIGQRLRSMAVRRFDARIAAFQLHQLYHSMIQSRPANQR